MNVLIKVQPGGAAYNPRSFVMIYGIPHIEVSVPDEDRGAADA